MEQQNNQLLNANSPKPVNPKIIWLVFFSAIVVYVTLAILLSSQENFGEDGFVGMDSGKYSLLLYAFLVISVLNFIVIFKLRSKTEIKPDHKPSGKESNYSVIRMALAESMAIFGLMLFLMNGNFNHLVLFAVLASFGMISAYPRN